MQGWDDEFFHSEGMNFFFRFWPHCGGTIKVQSKETKTSCTNGFDFNDGEFKCDRTDASPARSLGHVLEMDIETEGNLNSLGSLSLTLATPAQKWNTFPTGLPQPSLAWLRSNPWWPGWARRWSGSRACTTSQRRSRQSSIPRSGRNRGNSPSFFFFFANALKLGLCGTWKKKKKWPTDDTCSYGAAFSSDSQFTRSDLNKKKIQGVSPHQLREFLHRRFYRNVSPLSLGRMQQFECLDELAETVVRDSLFFLRKPPKPPNKWSYSGFLDHVPSGKAAYVVESRDYTSHLNLETMIETFEFSEWWFFWGNPGRDLWTILISRSKKNIIHIFQMGKEILPHVRTVSGICMRLGKKDEGGFGWWKDKRTRVLNPAEYSWTKMQNPPLSQFSKILFPLISTKIHLIGNSSKTPLFFKSTQHNGEESRYEEIRPQGHESEASRPQGQASFQEVNDLRSRDFFFTMLWIRASDWHTCA